MSTQTALPQMQSMSIGRDKRLLFKSVTRRLITEIDKAFNLVFLAAQAFFFTVH
jgi:hypothetical protein